MELPVTFLGVVGVTNIYRVSLADSGLARIGAFAIADDGRMSGLPGAGETGARAGFDLDFVKISNVRTDSPSVAANLPPGTTVPVTDDRLTLVGYVDMAFGFQTSYQVPGVPFYNEPFLRGSNGNATLDESVATLDRWDGGGAGGQVSLGEGGMVSFVFNAPTFGGGAPTAGQYLYFGDTGGGAVGGVAFDDETPTVRVSEASESLNREGLRLAGLDLSERLYLGVLGPNGGLGRGDDTLRGNGGDDFLYAAGGNNRFAGNTGNDVITGGRGFDTAHFSGHRSEYLIQRITVSDVQVTDTVPGRDGADVLVDIDALAFVKPAIYRFYNMQTGVHFFTTSEAERDYVKATFPQFQFEGEGMYALDDPEAADATPIYRFYNVQTQAHFYTASAAERDYVLGTFAQFRFEGIAFHQSRAAGDDLAEVHRFYNATTQAHFYTPSAEERDYVIASLRDWTYEGVAYHAPSQAYDPFLVG